MQNTAPLAQWLRRKLEPAADAPPAAYVSICPQEGRRSYPQRARVNVGDKTPDLVVQEVLAALADIDDSRRAEDNPLVRVKLHVYGVKGLDSVGEMVFVVGADLSGERADGDGSREGEMVAVVREMRMLLADAVGALGRASSSGYTLALESLKENARLSHELAETKAALMLAEQTQSGGMMEQAMQAVLPVVAAKMMAGPTVSSDAPGGSA
jgi:hypothetical protein